jgi:hypothetical protein
MGAKVHEQHANIPDEDGYSDETRPDWNSKCENCGQTPTVPITGLCGPCTFGEAETVGGNW